MPRKFKHKLGTKFRRNYTNEALESSLLAVVDGQFSFSQAAERFGVPKTTIYRKYKGLNSDTLGRPPVLSVPEEKTIVTALMTAANFGYPMAKEDVCKFVQSYLNHKGVNVSVFNENLPGNDWVESFLKRNNELAIRASENMKRARAAVTFEILNGYFDRLEENLKLVPSSNIINYDETNFTDDPGKSQIIVRKGVKHASRIMDFSKTSTSVMFCGAADGTILPPYIVYKAKNIYPEWIQGGPPGTVYNRSTSGWFDGDLFEDWFFKIALPYFKKLEGTKIMMGDNLASHLSLNIIKKCTECDIKFIFLPAHSTHLCQPLDVSYFRPLKAIWRKILLDYKRHHTGVLPKSNFPVLLNKALNSLKQNDEKNLTAGFRATGIYPLDRNQVLKRIPRYYANENVNSGAIEKSFTEILKDITKVNEPKKRETRRKINVPAGQSISVEDFDNKENNPEESMKKKTNEQIEPNEAVDCSEESADLNVEHCHKAPVTMETHLEENKFVVVQFTYNINKKMETEKQFVAQIKKISKQHIVVNCLRQYMGRKNSFIFPTIEDIAQVKLNQIKYILNEPKYLRGKYEFKEDIL